MSTVLESPANTGSDRRQTLRIVARNTAFMLGGQILIKIFGFIFSIYVVRQLGASDFGRYSSAMAYGYLFATFADLGLSTLAIREMARKPENISWMVPNIIAIRSVLSLAVIAITTLSAWILGKTPDMVLAIFIASSGLVLYAFQGPFESLMIARERLDLSSAFNVLNQVVTIVLGAIVLLTVGGYVNLLITSQIGNLVMALAFAHTAIFVMRFSVARPDPRRWWELLRASAPFGIMGIIGEFTRNFFVVFMSFTLTYAAVSSYTVPYNLVVMLLLMAQSLALSMYPSMVIEYNSGKGSIQDTVQRALRYLLLLSLPLAIGGTLLADRIIISMYGPELASAVPVMRILVWTLPFMFLAELLGRVISTIHREKQDAILVILNSALSIVLIIVFVPRLGAIGAALVMVINQFINVFGSVIIIGPKLLFERNLAPLGRIVMTGVVMGVIVWFAESNPLFSSLEAELAVLTLIALGAATYSVAALALRTVSPEEVRFLYGVVRRKLRLESSPAK
ncbi:MAG: flippase [Roseiflexaceae bacterium]|nr:flippase [Roseiflexaceae bacterium]